MDMLHYLDVAIGFTLAMMVLATLIGTTTAMWLAAIQSKVRNLEHGLTHVLSTLDTLDAPLPETDRRGIVSCLLRDSLMNTWSPWQKFGLGATDAIGREEFVLMVLRHASDEKWKSMAKAVTSITGKAPTELLRAVDAAIPKDEAAHPSDPAHVWRTRSLAQEVPALAARLFVHFDGVLARTDDTTSHSRKVAGAVLALAFLVAYPVNSFDLLARLVHGDAIAAGLAEEAAEGASQEKLLKSVTAQGLFGDVFSAEPKHREAISACKGDAGCSARAALNSVAGSLSQPGVWASFILVSLGVPFWQGLLDKLLGLRSKIATKTENEREQRAAQT